MTSARDRMFPVLPRANPTPGTPTNVPWWWVAQFEVSIMRNHNQSLEQLAARGGLSAWELYEAAVGRRGPLLITDATTDQWLIDTMEKLRSSDGRKEERAWCVEWLRARALTADPVFETVESETLLTAAAALEQAPMGGDPKALPRDGFATILGRNTEGIERKKE